MLFDKYRRKSNEDSNDKSDASGYLIIFQEHKRRKKGIHHMQAGKTIVGKVYGVNQINHGSYPLCRNARGTIHNDGKYEKDRVRNKGSDGIGQSHRTEGTIVFDKEVGKKRHNVNKYIR